MSSKKKGELKAASKIIPPSPMEVMFENMNSGSMKAEIMRKLPDGSLESASAKQLGGLGTKSRVAYATQNLKTLSPEARLAWAIEMKEFANELYANNEIQSAMEKYVEALSASDFGAKENDEDESGTSQSKSICSIDRNDGNVDSLIIPCLSNLAACCIQMKDFAKALKFADSALELRPKCGKVLMRRGMSLVYVGEYDQGIDALEAAAAITSDDATSDNRSTLADPKDMCTMPISDSDRVRIPILIDRAVRGKEREIRTKEKQKVKLRKVFGGKQKEGNRSCGEEAKSKPRDAASLMRWMRRKEKGLDDDGDDGIFTWWVPWVFVVALGLMAMYQLKLERFNEQLEREHSGELGF